MGLYAFNITGEVDCYDTLLSGTQGIPDSQITVSSNKKWDPVIDNNITILRTTGPGRSRINTTFIEYLDPDNSSVTIREVSSWIAATQDQHQYIQVLLAVKCIQIRTFLTDRAKRYETKLSKLKQG